MIDRRLKLLYRSLPLKEPLFRTMKALRLVPPPSIHQRLTFDGIVNANVNGSKFKMYGYGAIEASIFWAGLGRGWDGVTVHTWAKLCKRHRVIFDVGANGGVFSLIAKAVNPSSSVFAFEPMPRVFSQLERNRALNGFDIELVQKAVSNHDGFGNIAEPLDDLVGYAGGLDAPDPSIPSREIQVPLVKLSTFAEQKGLDRIDLIKIDVEGHEPEVIEGLGPLLKSRPTLLFEVWNEEIGGRGKLIESLLHGLDYLYFATDEKKEFHRVFDLQSRDQEKFYTNFIACTEEVASHLRSRNQNRLSGVR